MTNERVNWREVKEYSSYICTALVKRYGLKEGDTVSLFSQNSVWYPVVMFSCLKAGGSLQNAEEACSDCRIGAKISGASPAYNVEEMSYAMRTADSKFLFTAPSSMEVATAAANSVNLPKSNLFLLEGKLDGYSTVHDLIAIGKSYRPSQQVPSYKLPPGKRNRDVCGYLSFSSGTTGLPKAVMISHQNVIAQSMQIHQITPPESTHILAVLPLFHSKQ